MIHSYYVVKFSSSSQVDFTYRGELVRAAPALLLIDGKTSQRYDRRPHVWISSMVCRLQYARDTSTLTRHPCQQAAEFLPCV